MINCIVVAHHLFNQQFVGCRYESTIISSVVQKFSLIISSTNGDSSKKNELIWQIGNRRMWVSIIYRVQSMNGPSFKMSSITHYIWIVHLKASTKQIHFGRLSELCDSRNNGSTCGSVETCVRKNIYVGDHCWHLLDLHGLEMDHVDGRMHTNEDLISIFSIANQLHWKLYMPPLLLLLQEVSPDQWPCDLSLLEFCLVSPIAVPKIPNKS